MRASNAPSPRVRARGSPSSCRPSSRWACGRRCAGSARPWSGRVVVAHVRDGDLGESRFWNVTSTVLSAARVLLLLHHARLVRVEREALAREELVLQLLLAVPAFASIASPTFAGSCPPRSRRRRRGPRASRPAAACSIACLRTDLLERLVRLGSHLDAAVEQVHLVDEEVAEDARARTPTSARAAAPRRRPRACSRGRRVGAGARRRARAPARALAVGLDVVGAPQRTRRSGYLPSGSSRRAAEQPLDDDLGAVNGHRRDHCGSSACMFLPVGSTSGLQIGSPLRPGSTYSPSSAPMAPSSLSATTRRRPSSR